MTHSGGASALQHPSHAGLIQRAGQPGKTVEADARLDAIIVPASRPAKNLTSAIDLARAVGCHLVVLCSRNTRPDEVRAIFAAKHFGAGTAVRMPRGYNHPLLAFKTSEWEKNGPGKSVCGDRDSDLSAKRNVGLLIARMLRWKRVFFMDDDIRGISADALLRTVSLLGENGHDNRSAGLKVQYFPDNSVVCHARRIVGKDQDVFVSGSVLAVDCTANFAFFPDIYNEDWLFFYRDVAAKRLANSDLPVAQLPYDPFADRQRAANQEFGDIIAEGIYALLHEGLGTSSADEAYWGKFLDDRAVIIKEIQARLEKLPATTEKKIGEAVDAAQDMLWRISPDMCVSYLAAWTADLRQWEKRLDDLPRKEFLTDVLAELGLSPADPPL